MKTDFWEENTKNWLLLEKCRLKIVGIESTYPLE